MSSDVRVDIDDREVRRLLERTPKVFNSEFNRGFKRLGGAFFRKFGKERLRKGGVRVRRKVAKRSAGGGVSVPAKARAFGFRAALTGRRELEGKSLSMGTSNPVALIHETGGVIRPRRGRYLFVKVRSVAALRRAGVSVKRGQRPKLIRVKQVNIKAKLGFMKTWSSFIPEGKRRLADMLKRAAERSARRAKTK